ncbi:hypothetical protein SAMN05443667_101248 [Flavobacterium gillisiae]|uniref:CarboxypepD_reg-like domain-containing protein n=1 Tax=Flavobacterium gillisiae TaxID=150146 RepID=A0A1H3WWT4_9FLAO|nr:hypothetical protein [Flavobacterium gillisiae]SDZ90792.1 hypothetical protein SAMN05443667_101248 [Flavobacterium gillisiae]
MVQAQYFGDLLEWSDDLYRPITTPTIKYTPTVFQTAIATPVKPALITISATVLDEFGKPTPDANISVSGVGVATTNLNGIFAIKNVASNALIKVTYIGMENYEMEASLLPATIQMRTTAEGLADVVVKNNYKKPVSNDKLGTWLFWFSAIGTGVLLYKKYGTSKTIKAKI